MTACALQKSVKGTKSLLDLEKPYEQLHKLNNGYSNI